VLPLSVFEVKYARTPPPKQAVLPKIMFPATRPPLLSRYTPPPKDIVSAALLSYIPEFDT
jgi:hypothetical protein